VIEICSAPGAKLERLILNDDYVEIGTGAHADYGLPILGDYEGHAWIRYYDGSQTAADPMLLARYGTHPDRPWTADMVGTGLCYAILTFYYDREAMAQVRAPVRAWITLWPPVWRNIFVATDMDAPKPPRHANRASQPRQAPYFIEERRLATGNDT